jgi:hypothetical protein
MSGPPSGTAVALGGRPGLRASTVPGARSTDDGGHPTRIVRTDPADGARGVFRDAPVVAVLSGPVEVGSLSDESFAVLDYADGRVSGRLDASPDRRVVVWVPLRLLTPGVEHLVRVAGLRDARGRAIESHESTFVPCDVILADL